MRLEGKVAVVTGAGQGIGRAVAELFAREGARLVLNDLNRSTGEATCRLARKAGAHAELVAGDVSMPNTAKKLIVTALRHFDRIDVLVNNAGIGGSAHGDGPVTESREDSWDKILRVNLKSVFLCCRFAIPGLTRAMAAHYATRGVRVNAVCPGLIETPLALKAKRQREVMRYVRERQRLIGGMGSASDVAAAVLFLASDEARLITGAVLPLDAGWSAGS